MSEIFNSRLGRWIVSLLAWPVLSFTMAVQERVTRAAMGRQVSWLDAFRFPLVEYLFWALAAPLIFELAVKYPLRREERTRHAAVLLVSSFLLVGVHAVYRSQLHGLVYPIALYPENKQIDSSLLQFYVAGNIGADLWMFASIVAVAHLAMYYRRYRERDRELAQAQLQVLRAQLQPHFFFNTLNSIAALMHEDVNAADDMIANLGALLRRSLRDENEHEIPLREELEILELYTAIERSRFADRLEIRIHAHPDSLDALVPAFILQPLVENALRHGIVLRPGPGIVELRACVKDQRVCLTVSDDGAGLGAASPPVHGVGLSITRARLKHHYGDRHRFRLTQRPGGGAVAAIEIPYQRTEVRKP